jgi:hypothetical protein
LSVPDSANALEWKPHKNNAVPQLLILFSVPGSANGAVLVFSALSHIKVVWFRNNEFFLLVPGSANVPKSNRQKNFAVPQHSICSRRFSRSANVPERNRIKLLQFRNTELFCRFLVYQTARSGSCKKIMRFRTTEFFFCRFLLV